MVLERLLQINMAMLAALGTLLLGMGQRDALMPLGMLIAATASVVVTDVKGWFRLNRIAAGAAAFIAVSAVFFQTRHLEGESLLLAITNLLVVLQAILLFQPKDDRIYAQLIVLCLLEAVVSTLFAQGVWYGLLLGLELLAGMIALSLMYLVRQMRPFRTQPFLPASAANPPPADAPPRRWPLGSHKAQFRAAMAGSSQAAFGAELLKRLAVLGAMTIAISIVVFFAVPRFGESAWRGIGAAKKNLVGFNDTVTLGEMGEILEDPAEVMQVRFVRRSDGEASAPCPDIYLRGAILTRYHRGRWSLPLDSGEAGAERGKRATPFDTLLAADPSPLNNDKPTPLVQQIVIEPLDRAELFCVWPFSRAERNHDILFDARSQRLTRANRVADQRFGYKLGVSAFHDGEQSPITPCGKVAAFDAQENLLQTPELPKTAGLARDWLSQSPAADRMGVARRLESMLRDSGLFEYSLSGQPRNPKIDPIEDFVSQHRKGHCEYFNTALCMMLRSQGIPARIVAGYHTDEWNSAGKFYKVRQLHAHTWVEAYLAPADLPEALRSGDDAASFASGGWLRLDATPGFGGLASHTASWNENISQRFQSMRDLWDNYIVELNRRRQIESIYAPVASLGREIWRRLSDPAWWGSMLHRILETTGLASLGSAAAWVILATLAMALLAAVLWWIQRRISWRKGGKDRRRGHLAPRELEVEFYARFEAILSRRGCARLQGQTPREFALAAAHAPSVAVLGMAESTLVQVADLYYRVRFGRLPLDNPQRETLEQVLLALDTTPPKECSHVD